MLAKDTAVLDNLKKWQGYKFGLLIHMGLYSELGSIESWGLCPEEWVTREVDDYYMNTARTTGTQNPDSIPYISTRKVGWIVQEVRREVHDLFVQAS